MDTKQQVEAVASAAREAGVALARIDGSAKNRALELIAEKLDAKREDIYAANRKDLAEGRKTGLDKPRLKRLEITPAVMDYMIQGTREVAAMDDPVGQIESMTKRPGGMLVGKMRVPLGVVAMIFESRPNVVVDAGVLCLKSGNAAILRGGSEAFHSNMALAGVLREALEEAGLPKDAIQVLPTTDREAVAHMLTLDKDIDVVIPRGGEGLIRAVAEQARMPVLKHYKGVCHIYADANLDVDNAVEVIFNSKVQSPGVCNALECLLVHGDAAAALLPKVAERLGAAGVSFKACPDSLPLLGDKAEPAVDADWGYEFLDLILAVKVVADQDEAQGHIERYGSNHTEAILTRDYAASMRFIREVDASLVIANASIRFNDGGQLGLGAEIGISTSKLHAYGPMGIKELTSAKYVMLGEGQVRG